MPSAYEGFGVPYVEAMASGTAVVTTPNPGAMEVLQDGVYGEICTPEALGQAINALIGDTDRREAFVQRGLLRARDFDWDTIAGRYELAYANVLSKRMNLFERLVRRARTQ
jgi:glycosyltransferase involved in cell wall biosynthesis